MKISDLLAQAKNQLENSGVGSSKLDSLVLLTHALSVSKEQIIFNPDLEPEQTLQEKFWQMIARRAKREPVSHIIGKREFYGHDFFVTSDVLDPRPDSESLIELVLKKFPQKNSELKILEVGTGSGCLVITLLRLYESSFANGVDISEKALEICRKNAGANQVQNRLELFQSDLFSSLTADKKFDLIISNPPYIPSKDVLELEAEVKNFEPHLALDGGADGLDFYRAIAQTAPNFLQKNGRIILEIGFDQKDAVVKIFESENFIFEESQADLAGISRALCFNLKHVKMFIAKTVADIKSQLKKEKLAQKKIAFVPTMGALHDGHLALVKKAQTLADIVVVSIFVNKTQFNDQNDYKNYPRQNEDDLQKLKNCGVDYVFLPEDGEMFSADFSHKIIPTKLTDCLCGSTRPGHFDGVALIITKLFNIIKPDLAIFGEKDFQQLAIIKKLNADLNLDVEIFSQETLREKSGLAMSSRNQRLSEASKIKAAELFSILQKIAEEVKKSPQNIAEILAKKRQNLLENGFEKIDYLEIREEKNLEIVSNFNHEKPCRIFIAAYLDGIRLIDNLKL